MAGVNTCVKQLGWLLKRLQTAVLPSAHTVLSVAESVLPITHSVLPDADCKN